MSIKKPTRIKFGVGAAAVAILSLVIASFSLPVFAKDDAVAKKAVLYGIYKTCYMGNKMVTPVRSDEFRDIWSIAKSEGSFVLPTEWYNQYSVSCSQLIQNPAINSDFGGITSLTGITIPSSSAGSDKINSFLTGMGYTKEAGAKGKCATYTYNSSADGSGTSETITMCAGVDSSGRITDDQVTVSYSDYGEAMVQFELDEAGVVDLDCSQVFAHGGCSEHKFTKGETKFSELVGAIYADLQENRSGAVCGPLGCSWHLQPGAPITDQGDVQAKFKITSMNDAGDKAVKYLSKNAYANSNALKLTEKERISLLQGYMQDYYRVEVYGCNLKSEDADIAKGAGYTKATTNLKSGSGFQECWVKPTKNQSNSVAGFNNSFYFDGTMMNFDKVVKALNKAAKDQTKDNSVVSPTEGGTVEPSGEGSDGEGSDDKPAPCSAAAASLGWILCPVIQKLGQAVDGLYTNIENNYLRTDVAYVNNTSGTHTAWEEFRGFANIAFAIALIVIILSQVTGFGVSNYGIKKMLPSLIVVAILVNISFFLCQIGVDLSNIIGSGIKKLFEDINVGTVSEFGNGGVGSIISKVVATLFTGGTLVGVAALLANTAELWIMPFLLVLLVAVIGVIFFFITLGVRQAGIVVLITLCPIAIVCYALPNTKKVFERWWKMFVGLLLVYPICGLLMGGGQFASRLLLTSMGGAQETSFFSALVAVLIQVIPFFFIPSILRSSFQAMGNLGAKISSFGRGLSKTATGAIRKSDGYKDSQERLRANNARRFIRRENNRQDGKSLRSNILHPMEALNSRLRDGNGRLAAMAKNSYNRRNNRAQSAVLAQNLANRDRSKFYEQKHIDEVAGDYASVWDNNGTFANDSKTNDELEAALNDLRVDANNVDARARFTAAMRSLNTSTDGREYVDSTLNKAAFEEAQAGRTSNDGIKWAANAVRKAAGAEYKAKSPSGFADITEYASGDLKPFDANKFDQFSRYNKDLDRTETFYVRKDHQYAKANKVSAEQLANADDSYLDSVYSGLVGNSMKEDGRNNVIAQAREALNNPNIATKGDVEKRLQRIANTDYAPPVGSASSNGSASTVDNASVSRMANANQGELDRIIRGMENGSIRNYDGEDEHGNIVHEHERTEMANVAEATLNAANAGTVSLSQESAQKLNRIRALDGRAEIPYQLRVQHNPNAAPVPGGFEENGSGIVIPRNGQNGDMTGSQIRDFGRQMDRFNGGNNNNNGRNGNNNGGGPGIILP